VETGAATPLADVSLLPPIPDPGKLICIGLNYLSHAEEGGVEAPETPTFFAKFTNALVPGWTVALPAYSQKVDYEAEVAFVIGRRAKDVPEERALEYIAGYTLLNDLSARDYQFMTPQWMPGKVFDGSAPCGPALVTPDEGGAHDAIEITLTLNGEVMQSASTEDLFHSIPALVAHLSMLMTLEPGDIVSTGTPAGVGSVRQPRVWLKRHRLRGSGRLALRRCRRHPSCRWTKNCGAGRQSAARPCSTACRGSSSRCSRRSASASRRSCCQTR